eukprot:Gb_40625 [translate_table: standard]
MDQAPSRCCPQDFGQDSSQGLSEAHIRFASTQRELAEHNGIAYLHCSSGKWHTISVDFMPCTVRIEAAAGPFLLCSAISETHNLWRTFYVCNPITRAWKKLAQVFHKRVPNHIGMHVDSITKDFKVIISGYHRDFKYPGMHYVLVDEIEIYESRTDTWTKCCNPSFLRFQATFLCYDGFICLWDGGGVHVFDMATQRWEPRVCIPKGMHVYCVVEHRRRLLAIAREEVAGSMAVLELAIKPKMGWVNMRCISNQLSNDIPREYVPVCKNGNVILFENEAEANVIAYSLIDRTLRPMQNPPANRYGPAPHRKRFRLEREELFPFTAGIDMVHKKM